MRIGFAGHISTESVQHLLDAGATALPRGYYGAPLLGTLIGELLRRGHEVCAYTTSSDMAAGARVVATGPRFRLTYCASRPRAFRYSNGQWGRAADGFAREREALVRAMREDAPDLIHAHWCYEFAQAAIDSGLPHVVTCHDAPHVVLSHSRDLYRFVRFLMARRVLKRAQRLTAVSPYLRDQLSALTPTEITVVPNPLPVWSSEAKCAHRRDLSAPRILTLLNGWGARKNPQAALRAFASFRNGCPGARLRMLGSDYGPDGKAARWALANGCAHGVSFVGSVPHSRVREELANTDLLLHPALEETFGMAVVEALQLGVPVVGGQASGAVPWVVGGGGVLTDVRDPEKVMGAMRTVLSDAARHAAMAAQGRVEASARFDTRPVIEAYEAIYAKAVGPGCVARCA